MPFNFRLQKILDWIAVRESRKQQEIAAADRRLSELRLRQQGLAACLRERLASAADEPIGWIQWRSEAVAFDLQSLQQLESQLRETLRTLERQRTELACLARTRRGLEAARDRRWQECEREESHREVRRLDEIFQQGRLALKNG